MPSRPTLRSDYDGAWKSAVHLHLPHLLETLFPAIATHVDWSSSPRFLSQELEALALPGSKTRGAKRVDFLIEVRLLTGERKIIYLHLEVQSARDPLFAQRTYLCNQLICTRVGQDVVTLAILADLDPSWRPCRYQKELLGCRVVFEFPVCKLLDLLPTMEKQRSLASLLVRSQIAALQTRGDAPARLKKRLELCAELRHAGWSRKEIIEGLRLVSWMMRLPKAESLKFREVVSHWPEMKLKLPLTDLDELYLDEVRQETYQKGRQQGRQEGHTEGMQCGEWIGKIELLEEMLGQKRTPLDELRKLTLRHLKARFAKLEKHYHRRFRR